MRAINPEQEEKSDPLRKFIKYGKWTWTAIDRVGVELARKLQVSVGDK